ncbi:hypothetical protein CNMCM8927_001880 [Aspergillus lentulus]|uniref:Carrier domain-containing protein n=1 Tax=Aspergillus lentulus TaxID=293939 RepID=A0AAN5YHJ3_ASPLE|nr:hypothetical protein CNMCM8927_001880 [Aspergillus lentulus]
MVGVIDTASETVEPPRRLLAAVVDSLAIECPTRRFCLIPNGTEVHQGFREVTLKELCRAVNTMSWWMEKHLGSSVKGETIAYLGSNDIRYIILMLASHKTGCTIFFPSTRLSNEAYDSVFGATRTKMLLFSPEKHHLVSGLTGPSKSISSLEVPSVTEMLNDNLNVKHYDFASTYEEMEDKTAFIIHSSGTTGMPKSVSLTHGFLGTVDYSAFMPRPSGRSPAFFQDLLSTDPHPSNLVLSVTPYFHMMGLVALFESIFHNIPFVTIPDQPLSVNLLIDVIHATHPTATILPPSILEDMSLSQEALECLSTLKFVCYGGAPLAKQVGDKVSQYTQVRNPIGSTEMGIISSLVPEGKENWGYFEWNPTYGIDMQSVTDDLYELVIPRVEDSRRMHGIFHTFPALKEYRSKDLYVRHPEIPKLWQYRGRLDDVIVLSNGEKLNPVTLEKVVEGHPSVRRALVFGQGRFQTGLLIEPAIDDHNGNIDEQNFVDMIWPSVQIANKTVPRYGQVLKNMIRLASPRKPFKLTPKGTTQRHVINADYAEEIDALYAAAQDKQLGAELPSTIDFESVHRYVHEVITSLTGRSDIKPSDDLFGLGLDSLQAIELSNLLRNAVSSYNLTLGTESITVQNVYARPTTEKLAGLLLAVLQEQAATAPTASRSERIAGLVSKYTGDLPIRSFNSSAQLPPLSTVILTGSTGSLGTYILSGLLNDPKVAKVYCFNRAADAGTRQQQGFAEKGLDASSLKDPSKVEFLHVSFGDKNFGLGDAMYSKLLDTVDLIIHNAWKVNFNHPVSSFEDPHIKGVRELVNFSLESRYNAHLAFVSSVSTIAAWTPTSDESAVPESPMETVDSVLKQGYGESKHVGERICSEASRRSGVPTSVLRVGQIAGPDSRLGLWNPHEWLPSVVKTSKTMGKVPDTLGSFLVDWIAVDTLARITIEILLSRRPSLSTQPHAVFHLTNTSRIPWNNLIPAIQERYPVSVVSLAEWVDELEHIPNPSPQDLDEKPALKLLSFYQALAHSAAVPNAEISVENSKQASRTMASLGPVSRAQMSNWLNHVMSDFQVVRGARNMESRAPAMSGTSSSKLENLIVPDAHLEPMARLVNGAFDDLSQPRSSTSVHIVSRWFSGLPALYGRNETLDATVRCFTAHHISKVLQNPQMARYSRSAYIEALSRLRKSLNAPSERLSADIFCAVLLLCLYELFANNQNPDTWMKHAKAVSQLAEIRGPNAYKDPFNNTLLKAARGLIVMHSLFSGERCFLASDRWHAIMKQRINSFYSEELEDLLEEFIALFTLAPSLVHALYDIKASDMTSPATWKKASETLTRILEMQNKLSEWYSRFSRMAPPPYERLSSSNDAVYPIVLHYSDLNIASIFNSYHAYMAIIHEALRTLGYPGEHEAMVAFFRDQICKSVEYNGAGPLGPYRMGFPLRVAYEAADPKTKAWIENRLVQMSQYYAAVAPKNFATPFD